ncbi:MAG TPA: bifunctional 4-hydroxy-2-oxoglutarate aldolase/2-dehydro-3-deoxy-phosphogluconate aldolase [Steroidobacteraceae bacterium]|nr:bifunctional 4-hydroxy-2-oxoglutarate aldolase/2-dehydro-3-deoxy-phosphogluconate aldolase [Steroidobacteraceae bacterium]
MRIEAYLALSPVMPVVTIRDVSVAVDLARALVRGGIPVIEIALRTPGALQAIESIVRQVPEIAVGAGTILYPADLQAAAAAGAAFAISPGSTHALLDAAAKAAIPYLPGVATASELMVGIAAGYRYFKFFPAASAGGRDMLKALSGPFPDVRFCPTGGITSESAASYLGLPNVMCVGGSWLTPDELMAEKDWRRVETLAARAASLRAGPDASRVQQAAKLK